MLAIQQNQEISVKPTLPDAAQRYHQTLRQQSVETGNQTETQQTNSQAIANKRKSTILVEATRDFCRLDRPDEIQSNSFKEFFYQFIENLAVPDKRVVSAMLARLDYTPRPIALYLAMEKIEIAAPFLLFSPVLGEADLTAIAQKMGADHARVIERRHWDNSKPVTQTSRTAFLHETKSRVISKRLETKTAISEKSMNDQAEFISPPMDERNDKGDWLSSDEILALASVGGKLGKYKTKQVDRENKENSQISKRPDAEPLLPLAVEMLIKHAKNLNYNAFAMEASKSCGMDVEDISYLVNAPAGEELVYFIKALAMPAPKDIQLLLMLAPRFGRSVEAFRTANRLLSNLDTGVCRMIFNQIGARFQIPGAPKPTQITGDRRDPEFASAVRARQAQISGSRANLTLASKARSSFGRKAS